MFWACVCGHNVEEGAGPDDESRLVNVDVNDVQILYRIFSIFFVFLGWLEQVEGSSVALGVTN